MSKWQPDGPCAYASDDGKWMINRAPQTGLYRVLVELGSVKLGSEGGRAEVIAALVDLDIGDQRFAA